MCVGAPRALQPWERCLRTCMEQMAGRGSRKRLASRPTPQPIRLPRFQVRPGFSRACATSTSGQPPSLAARPAVENGDRRVVSRVQASLARTLVFMQLNCRTVSPAGPSPAARTAARKAASTPAAALPSTLALQPSSAAPLLPSRCLQNGELRGLSNSTRSPADLLALAREVCLPLSRSRPPAAITLIACIAARTPCTILRRECHVAPDVLWSRLRVLQHSWKQLPSLLPKQDASGQNRRAPLRVALPPSFRGLQRAKEAAKRCHSGSS